MILELFSPVVRALAHTAAPGLCRSVKIETKLTYLRRKYLHTARTPNHKNYYSILGISKDATPRQIKLAYYKLAKAFHPDSNKNDSNCQTKFLEVSEAYEILSDNIKRKEYDAWGKTSDQFSKEASQNRTSNNQYDDDRLRRAWSYTSTVNPEDMFRDIFGRDLNSEDSEEDITFQRSLYGYDGAKEILLNISFEEAACGTRKFVMMNIIENCERCRGTRCELGSCPVKCPTCDGTGMESVSTGPFLMRSTCRDCEGKGDILRYPCVECEGKGKMVYRRHVPIIVPAGVFDGESMEIKVGDIEICATFRVRNSELFKRDGYDVHSEVHISMGQAVFGGSTRLQGLYGPVDLLIPRGTSSHDQLKLPRQGILKPDGKSYGDHIVHIHILIPQDLTHQQKMILQAVAELETDTPGTVDGVSLMKEGRGMTKTSNNFKESSCGLDQCRDPNILREMFQYLLSNCRDAKGSWTFKKSKN